MPTGGIILSIIIQIGEKGYDTVEINNLVVPSKIDHLVLLNKMTKNTFSNHHPITI